MPLTSEEREESGVQEWLSYGDCCISCDDEDALHSRGCISCQLYRCPCCQQVCSWSEGGTDSELCDDCWALACTSVTAIFNCLTGGP